VKELPESGTVGQVLTYGDEPTWQAPAFVATATQDLDMSGNKIVDCGSIEINANNQIVIAGDAEASISKDGFKLKYYDDYTVRTTSLEKNKLHIQNLADSVILTPQNLNINGNVGSTGQILTKNVVNEMTWADRVSDIPEGGSAGNILVYGESELPVWTAPRSLLPTGLLPEGGAEGQVLQYGSGAPLWAAPPSALPEGGAAGKILAFGEAPMWVTQTGLLPEGGAEGQVLQYGSGSPLWADAPSALPEGGAQGQVLLYDSGSPVWAAPPSALPAGGEDGQILIHGIPPIWVTPYFVAPTAEADFGGNAITNVSEMTIQSVVDSVTRSATVTPTGITVVNGLANQTLTFAQLGSKLGGVESDNVDGDTTSYTFPSNMNLLFRLNIKDSNTTSLHFQLPNSAQPLQTIEIHSHGCLTSTFGGLGISTTVPLGRTVTTCVYNSGWTFSQKPLGNEGSYGQVLTKIGGVMAWASPAEGEIIDPDDDISNYEFPSEILMNFRLRILPSENTNPINVSLPTAQMWQKIEIYSDYSYSTLTVNNSTLNLANMLTTCTWADKWYFTQTPFVQPVPI
jgi:hypothetical protein